MKIGSVVQVRSFSEYVIKAPVDPDAGYLPASNVRAGAYVSIRTSQGHVIGVVSDVLQQVKEDYLPYLPPEKQEIFTPYVADFRSSYVVVRGIGNVRDGRAVQSLEFTPAINDVAGVMSPEDVRAFHMLDGRACFTYYRKLSQAVDPGVVAGAIETAIAAMPECAPMLRALKKYTENKHEAGRHR